VSALLISIVAFVGACAALRRAYLDHRRTVTELQRFRTQVLDLQSQLQLRGNLANEVAHEIKNPLTAILCSAETLDLLLGPKLDPDHRQSLRYIRDYGENLLRLVSDFLDVSRGESGLLECAPKQLEIEPVIDSVLGLLRANAQRKKIDLTYENACGPVQCWVDGRHFKQVIFNLTHNAIKFTPYSGKVVVRMLTGEDGHLCIEVEDSGPGIPPEQIPKLFQLYSRYERDENRSQVGIGLGLALCKSLVELNKGQISVESKEGQGAKFTVSVPLVAADETTIGVPSSTMLVRKLGETRPLAGQTFLLVDKNSAARNAMAKLIEAWGGVVDGVSEAADAIRALEHRDYQAIMIDADSNPQVGVDLARRIRNELPARGAAVILAGDADLVGPEGLTVADSCIPKPLNGNLLLRSLGSLKK
jgi:signal transduction histidine kinase